MRKFSLLRPLPLLLASLFATGCGPAIAPIAGGIAGVFDDAQMSEYQDQLRALEDRAQDQDLRQKDWREADAGLRQAMADARFARLSDRDRAEAWHARAWAAVNLDDDAAAKKYFQKAVDLYPDDPWFWLGLAQDELSLDEFEAGAKSMLEGLKRKPELMQRMDSRLIRIANRSAPGSKATLSLLRFVLDHDWHSIRAREGDVWKRLALEELRDGDRAAAQKALRRIATPDGIIRVRMDKRLDGLYDPASPAFDVDKVAAARIAFLEAQAKDNPDSLEHLSALNREFLASGRFERVLESTDAIAKAIKANLAEPPFKDMDELATIREQRSDALGYLGRQDESLAKLEEAASIQSNGHANVSQSLDLALRYCREGNGAKALSTLAKTGKSLSPYGSMVYHLGEHCASRLQGEDAKAGQALAYLQQHRADGPEIYLQALLIDGRLDEAARDTIERLQSEQLREDILYSLQEFPDAPEPNSRLDPKSPGATTDRNWEQLKQRPDVLAAVDRVGRIGHYATYGY